MAILGRGGELALIRESPPPTSVGVIDRNAPNNSFQLSTDAIWSGDQVTLTSPNGLPFFQAGGFTMAPGGQGIWSDATWDYAPGYENIEGGDQFWNEAPAFPWADAAPAVTSLTVYAYVDQLGRIRFYDNWPDAVNGDPLLALETGSVDFGVMTITSIDADWTYLCDIRDWTLELSAPSVDVTGIGGKFGEAVKSLVTGGGDIGYLAERRDEEGRYDPTALLRLLLLTQHGCKAAAQFWILEDRLPQGACPGQEPGSCSRLAPGDFYYKADLLVVGTSLNLAAADLVGGAARFVTTGEIRLLIGV